MTERGQSPRQAGRLAFNQLTIVVLIAAAALPVLVLGLLVFSQVERALAQDAVERTERALGATDGIVEQAARDLEALTRSYAEWTAFATMTANSDLGSIRTDVLEFLVERGSVAAGVVETPSASVSAGGSAVTAALESIIGTGGATPRVIAIDGGLYLIDDLPVDAVNEPGTEVGRILLARRLDARFAADIRQITGFETALLDDHGEVSVSTDPTTTDAAILGGVGSADRRVLRVGDLVTSLRPMGEPPSGGSVVLATRVSGLQVTAGGLPMLVLGLLGATVVMAGLLGLVLARALSRRLAVIHDGLAAIADGRVAPRGTVPGDDDIARLAAGLDRLVETLDRRETTLRRCLSAAATVPASATPAEAAQVLASAANDILGTTWCQITSSDGGIVAAAVRGGTEMDELVGEGPGRSGDPSRERVIEAPMGLDPDHNRLEAGLALDREWTDGDQAGFDVMALLAGTVIRDAEQYRVAVGRAERLDRRNRLQREFLRGISHNLLAPLATIELAASDLVDDPDTAEFSRTRAAAIQIEERRLTRLVNQVLILSRIETGMLELDGAPLPLVSLVRRVAAELDVDHLVSIVDHTGGELAFADGASTEQILWVIVDNAIRYAGSRPINVELSLSGAADPADCPWVRVAIEDQGPGVPVAERRRIFRRFVRGSGTHGVGGSGLGLNVARGLARAMGGDVVCRAGAVGARFEVTLQRAVMEAEPGRGDTRPVEAEAEGLCWTGPIVRRASDARRASNARDTLTGRRARPHDTARAGGRIRARHGAHVCWAPWAHRPIHRMGSGVARRASRRRTSAPRSDTSPPASRS